MLNKLFSRTYFVVRSTLQMTIFLSVLSLSIHAQTPQWDWVKTAKGSSTWPWVEGRTVATDNYSNSYITGVCSYCDTISFESVSLISNSGGAMYTVKYDSTGSVVWARFDGDNNATIPTSIAADASGNIYVTGTFTSPTTQFGSTTLTNTNSSTQDIFLVKYNSSGNIIWTKSLGGSQNEWSESVAVDYMGNIFITGAFLGPSLTIGSSTLINTNASSEDIFIAKLDSNGTELWAKSAGSTNYEWAIAVTTDDFGNSFICGPYWSPTISFDNIILSSSFGAKMFTASYDAFGNIRWAKSVILSSNASEGYLYSLDTDAFGNTYVTGSFNSSDTVYVDGQALINTYGNSYKDMIIIKYDTSGNSVWAKRVNTKGGELYPMALTVNSSGESYIAGYYSCDTIFFDASNFLPTDFYYWEGLFIVKYDSNGNVMWSKAVDGGVKVDGTYFFPEMGITTDIIGNVWVTGSNYLDSIAYDSHFTYLENCSQNIFLAKLNDSKECSAYFELAPDSVTPHKYWIINLATGASPISYLWQWGDGTSDTAAYPNHTYATQGFYTICLTITDASGCTDTKCFTYDLQKMAGTMIEVNVIPPTITSVSENIEENIFSAYPNPANEDIIITFNLNKSSNVELELYNSIGQKVYVVSKSKYELGNHQITFSVSEFQSGLYYLQYKTVEKTGVIKIVKM